MIKKMSSKIVPITLGILLPILAGLPFTSAAEWHALGPFGGDVRTLAQDPKQKQRLYLGTADSQIFVSDDSGASWNRLSAVISKPDFVIDHILIDPQDSNTLYAGIWSVSTPSGGGVFKSEDGGGTWAELPAMHNQSVRALSLAPSDPRILLAGTLEGVFRSHNAGATWTQISPLRHEEIKNVESIAVDPYDPQIIYIGTWHLPWKTTDGGQNWFPIKQGIVDDSDVFSIFIDPVNPQRALLSACTGVYQSSDAGNFWTKFKGIPTASRRTRVILSDPTSPNVIYAGTTEGLWKTEDGGASWRLASSRSLTVNAIILDSRSSARVYLGTEDAGFLVSTDRARTFVTSNSGFTSRAVSSVLVDPRAPGRIWAGVLYDQKFGGVFLSEDAGTTWKQLKEGLTCTDIHVLFQSSADDSLWAGTETGAYKLIAGGKTWQRADLQVIDEIPSSNIVAIHGKGPVRTQRVITQTRVPLKNLGSVMSFSGEPKVGKSFYAATSRGLFLSRDGGKLWKRVRTLGFNTMGTSVLVLSDSRLFYGTSTGLLFSTDDGLHWTRIPIEGGPSPVHIILPSPEDNNIILAATGNGLIRSEDGGKTWQQRGGGLPLTNIVDIRFDPFNTKTVYAAESHFGMVYRSSDLGSTWEPLEVSPGKGLRMNSFITDPFDPTRSYFLLFREGLYMLTDKALAGRNAGASDTNRAKSNPHEKTY